MANGNPDSRPRITVAEAISRAANLITNHPDKNRFPDEVAIYAEVVFSPDGTEVHPPNGKTVVERIDGRETARRNLRSAFFAFCKATGIIARNLHNPWQTDSYSGGPELEDYRHDISVDEYEKWSAPYLPSKDEHTEPSIGNTETWKFEARRIACDVYLEAEKNQYGTDQKSVSDKVAARCKAQGITTDKGKTLSSSYILRHALSPWDIPTTVLANRQNQKN